MNVFQKIINHEIPAQIIYEDDRIIAFEDINPKDKGHFLVVPKIFSSNLIEMNQADLGYLMEKAVRLANEVMTKHHATGFNLIVNNGTSAGQEVMHTHVHIIPRY